MYGTLLPQAPPFEETTAYAPNSPYAASKAASDDWCARTCTVTLPVYAPMLQQRRPDQFPSCSSADDRRCDCGNACRLAMESRYGTALRRRPLFALRAVLERGRMVRRERRRSNEQAEPDTVHLLRKPAGRLSPVLHTCPRPQSDQFVTDRPATIAAMPSTPIRSTRSSVASCWRRLRPVFVARLSGTWCIRTGYSRVTSGAWIAMVSTCYAHRVGAGR